MMRGGDSGEAEESPSTPAFRWSDTTSELQSVRLATQYVMEGMASFDIEVVAASIELER